MRSLINDAAADEATVNEVAGSAATWWGVQRQINTQRETTRTPWPPIAKLWRLAFIGVPVAAVLVIAISFFALRPAVTTNEQAHIIDSTVNTPMVQTLVMGSTETSDSPKAVEPVANSANHDKPRVISAKFTAVRKKASLTPTLNSGVTVKKLTEIKTDFIALSYARNPDSGQIVRVKVPSSMMVTLGLVATVERPSSLVDAEVLVGDDGLTRAIRFIH